MTNIIGPQSNKAKVQKKQNSIESIKNFDQFFGNYNPDYQKREESGFSRELNKPVRQQRKEFSVFNYQHYYENEIVRKEIKQLTQEVTRELELLKKADSALAQETQEIQRISLQSLPEKPGIYHIRFLEIILRILKNIRAKIGESRTWLQAMISKKKKRGSLFTVRSKKQGTLYSLSQELQSARSIQ